jgi:hypothetical protein
MQRFREILGWVLLLVLIPHALLTAPKWSLSSLEQPVYLAAAATVPTVLTLLALRLRKIRGSGLERAVLALFLAGMPPIYVSSWLIAPQAGWLPIEIVGVVVFGALAVLGYLRSPWFLAAGIAGHGVFWDLWHAHRQTFVADWYTFGCLEVDLMLGLYVALEIPHFRARARADAAAVGAPSAPIKASA